MGARHAAIGESVASGVVDTWGLKGPGREAPEARHSVADLESLKRVLEAIDECAGSDALETPGP